MSDPASLCVEVGMSIVSVLAALTSLWLLVSTLALIALLVVYAAERGGWPAGERAGPGEPTAPTSLHA